MKPRDLTGSRFHHLLITASAGTRKTPNGTVRTLWNCICDCGNAKTVNSNNLRSGKTKSCGCRMTIRKPDEICAQNHLYATYRANARSRGHEFALTKDEFLALIKSDCHYCGMPPELKHRQAKAKRQHIFCIGNGIDRSDNAAGYTPENSLPCCAICNRAKREMPYEEFMAWIKRIQARKDKYA